MRAFVVVPEGDLFYIMQVCPEYLLSPVGACPYALYCDCALGDDGALWQERGYFKSRGEAQRRADAFTHQFERDCARQAASLAKRRDRELRSSRVGPDDLRVFHSIDQGDVPY